jgi:hypothetical protein
MLRQGDSQVFKKYSQMKLQMKREALDKINRRANEMLGVLTQQKSGDRGFETVRIQSRKKSELSEFANGCKCFNINTSSRCGRVAQLGEHLLCKQGVAGSNPVTSTKLFLLDSFRSAFNL